MNLWYIPLGIGIGFVVSAPVGPVNLLCFSRGLSCGPMSAFVVGLGAALGDAIFAAVAAFGVSTFTDMVAQGRDPIRIVGGLVLIGFSLFVWRAQPQVKEDHTQRVAPWRQSIAAFAMTVTNPGTLMGFAAIFAGAGMKNLGARTPEHVANSAVLVLGVFCGCMLWWGALSVVSGKMQQRISQQTALKINKGSAIALALLGLGAVAAGVMR